jgi:hypothetical protein
MPTTSFASWFGSRGRFSPLGPLGTRLALQAPRGQERAETDENCYRQKDGRRSSVRGYRQYDGRNPTACRRAQCQYHG